MRVRKNEFTVSRSSDRPTESHGTEFTRETIDSIRGVYPGMVTGLSVSIVSLIRNIDIRAKNRTTVCISVCLVRSKFIFARYVCFEVTRYDNILANDRGLLLKYSNGPTDTICRSFFCLFLQLPIF